MAGWDWRHSHGPRVLAGARYQTDNGSLAGASCLEQQMESRHGWWQMLVLGLRAGGRQKRVDDVRISQGGSPFVGINGLCDELAKLIELSARESVEELLGPLLTSTCSSDRGRS